MSVEKKKAKRSNEYHKHNIDIRSFKRSKSTIRVMHTLHCIGDRKNIKAPNGGALIT